MVEDDALTRLAIVAALSSRGLQVVTEADSGAQALAKVAEHAVDVAVLDLHLGSGPSGLDVAHALRRKNPGIGLVFLTSFDDPRLLDPSIQHLPGGSQYLTKSSIRDIETLLRAVDLATQGIGKTAKPGVLGGLSVLTNTQVETLRLLADGLSNSEIAKKRFVTERSVEVAISRIAKALGLSPDATRNQRVHMAKVYFRSVGGQGIDA